jgi:hypothetical protein
MDDEHTVELFRQRLGETIRWCSQRQRGSVIAERFRSPALQPALRADGELDHWKTAEQRNEVVETLIRRRAWLLASANGAVEVESAGRIVTFAPEESLHDGAACLASQGYFDDANVPGWDAWICYVMPPTTAQEISWPVSYSSYLLGWVPEEVVPLVEHGIEVNPESCLMWASMLEGPFFTALRRANLLT